MYTYHIHGNISGINGVQFRQKITTATHFTLMSISSESGKFI